MTKKDVAEIVAACESAGGDLGAAMRAMTMLDVIPYCKWCVSGSFYHGIYVTIVAPDESQQFVPHRDASLWYCPDGDELPELITRAVRYSLMQDVKKLYGKGGDVE